MFISRVMGIVNVYDVVSKHWMSIKRPVYFPFETEHINIFRTESLLSVLGSFNKSHGSQKKYQAECGRSTFQIMASIHLKP